jgi:hypothetical protein
MVKGGTCREGERENVMQRPLSVFTFKIIIIKVLQAHIVKIHIHERSSFRFGVQLQSTMMKAYNKKIVSQ